MAIFKIPTSSTLPWYSFKTTLTGTVYTLELRYNLRMQRWMLNILDANNTPILMGVALLIGRSVSGQYRTLSVPEGALFALDDTGAGNQPTLSSFLTSHSFYYLDSSA